MPLDDRLGSEGIRFRDLTVKLAADLDRCQQDILTLAAVTVGVPPLEWPSPRSSQAFIDWWLVVKQIVLARAAATATLRSHEASRARCPWCGDGTTLQGFLLPRGLEQHWRTTGRLRQCPVGRAVDYVLRRLCERERPATKRSNVSSGDIGVNAGPAVAPETRQEGSGEVNSAKNYQTQTGRFDHLKVPE